MSSSNPEQIAAGLIGMVPLLFHKISQAAPPEASPKKADELTHLQQHILEELLQQQNGFSMSELAKRIRISKQQLTPLIVKLEEKRLVAKLPSEDDRRVTKLQLSEAGAAQAQKRWTEVHRVLSMQLDKLTAEERHDLDYAIGKLTRILAKLS